jgi:hypothetical protein
LSLSSVLSLWRLRLRLNAGPALSQVALNTLVPTGFAILLARSHPEIGRERLVISAFLASGLFAVLRTPAFLLIVDRTLGTRVLLQAAGASRRSYLAANALDMLYFALFPLAAMGITAAAIGASLPTNPTAWLMLGTYLLALHGASLWAAALARDVTDLSMSLNSILAVLMAVTPVYYQAEKVPRVIRPIIDLAPTTLTSSLTLDTYAAGLPPAGHAVLLVAWAVLLLLVGYAAFARAPISGTVGG